MRNPWPMFFVLALTGIICVMYPVHTVWLLVAAIVLLFIAWIIVPIKYDDWMAKKLNPYILEYQQGHNLAKLEAVLQKWRPWAITKESKNTILINWFCALLEHEQWEKALKISEEIRKQAKTSIGLMNYHLLMVKYAERTGNQELANQERQLHDKLKTEIQTKNSGTKEPATAQQGKRSFLLWLSFSLTMLICGVLSIMLAPESLLSDLGATAVIISIFAMPVSVVWMIVWLMRRKKEKSL